MQQAWHILRKDLRHLWPYVLVWNLLAALMLVARPVELFDYSQSLNKQGLLEFLLPVGAVLIIALVVHGEALPGTTQFWLARPYRWSSLLAAKLAFVVLFLHVPVFFLQLGCLARNGLPAVDLIPMLLSLNLWRFLLLGLIGVAVAAITRQLGHFALAALSGLALSALVVQVFSSVAFYRPNWGDLYWIPNLLQIFAGVLTALAVIAIQYRLRRTRWAVAVALGGLLGSFALVAALPYRAAVAWQARRSPGAPPPLRISLSADNSGPKMQKHHPNEGFVLIHLPVNVEGLGERDLESSAMELRVDGLPVPDLLYPTIARGASGRFVHVVQVPRRFYEQKKDRPVRMEWTALVHTFRTQAERSFPLDQQSHLVPGLGRCESRHSDPSAPGASARCLIHAAFADRVLARFDNGGDHSWLITRGFDFSAPFSSVILPVRVHPWWRGDAPPGATRMMVRLMTLDSSAPYTFAYDNVRLSEYLQRPQGAL